MDGCAEVVHLCLCLWLASYRIELEYVFRTSASKVNYLLCAEM